MKFLIVDDEPYAVLDLEGALKEVSPDCETVSFSSPAKALSYGKDHCFDAAFLDIELGTMNGLILAKQLKEVQPNLPIIFVTSYEKYAVEAFAIHATGYLLKPVKSEDIERELTFLYGKQPQKKSSLLRVQTFGGFEVFSGDTILTFKRAKAKELFAYLVDCRGISATTRMVCSVLWDDGRYDRERKNYFHTILADLKQTLKEAGAEEVLLKSRNSLAVDVSRLDCDSYRFLDGEPAAVNSYRGDYMLCYSWAEFSVGQFEKH